MGYAIADGIDNYVKREGQRIYVRPTRWTNIIKANEWTNPMDASEARKMAAELIRLAAEAEKPDYKPGRVYRSTHGNRYLRTRNGKWAAFSSQATGWHGDILTDAELSHPMTEVVI